MKLRQIKEVLLKTDVLEIMGNSKTTKNKSTAAQPLSTFARQGTLTKQAPATPQDGKKPNMMPPIKQRMRS